MSFSFASSPITLPTSNARFAFHVEHTVLLHGMPMFGLLILTPLLPSATAAFIFSWACWLMVKR